MRKLYSDYSALCVRKVYDTLEWFYVAVGPDPLGGDEIERRSM